MTAARTLAVVLLAASAAVPGARGQISSLGEQKRRAASGEIPAIAPREAPRIQRNAVYHRYSWLSGVPRKPKSYKVGDLITVIVRERREFESEAELQTRKKLTLESQLDAFLKLTQGGIGASPFRRGKPTVDYEYNNRLRSQGDIDREDNLTLRLTTKVIDVKPNGVLVLEGKGRVQHDDEVSHITLTGTCRKEDITADNTVLSTQLADKNVVVENHGAMRATSSRGWLLKLLDLLGPF